VKALRVRLGGNVNRRRICGFRRVPDAATFSRRLKEFAGSGVLDRVLNGLVRQYQGEGLVGHICRDSTAIEARERPVNCKREVAPPRKRGRGRPRKGESRPEKKERRLARQLSMKSGAALREVEKQCSWGCKKNSQGNVMFWKGYKLHLDVTDWGLPVTAVVTGASVHDSQVALPMEKVTERRVQHLYRVMDSAYDAPEIRGYIQGRQRVALIEPNRRRRETVPGLDPAHQERYKVRTVVERTYSHLKDSLIPAKLYVRGYAKVKFHLFCGVVCLAAIKILQHFILPSLQN